MAQTEVLMHVPETPSASQVAGGAPLLLELLELELLELELLLELLLEPLLLELLELELLLELLLLELELLAGVQHSMSAPPGQRPEVDLWPGIALHADVSMQVPATLPTSQEV